ncbi:hypothetical protein CYY_006361 [Polysphondylium violaceum]|uniref:Acylamino-acid-releasing enzyme n=1 Tax=Polysphondylium violaceum TaxID=133409 RepID=A0A8J4PR84_9MYCE|nr:hypothetical protein CYY_006361 [Polysphondylium violaceum]
MDTPSPPSSTSENLEYRNKSLKLYKDIISVPTVVNSFFNSSESISIVLSQTDSQTKKNKQFITTKYVLPTADKQVTSTHFLNELVSPLISQSPSHTKQITIKDTTTNPENIEYSFEISDRDHHLTTIPSRDIHKKVCSDEWFGTISWSPCEKYIAFIADSKINTTSFYDREPKDKIVGDQFLYRDDWGETYSPISNPSIFIVDIEKEAIFPLEPFPSEKLTAGQVIWTPDGKGLVFVGWSVSVRKLGIRACFNRISSLYHFDFASYLVTRQEAKDKKEKPTKPLVLTNLIPSVSQGCFRSPRFSPDGKSLIFMGFDEKTFPHNTCSKLFKLNWAGSGVATAGQKPLTLIDYKNHNDEFPGLYCQDIPINPWIDNSTIVFSAPIKSTNQVLSFNIDTKQLNTLFASKCSYSVQDVDLKSKQFIMTESGLNQPTLVYLIDYHHLDKKVLLYKPVVSKDLTDIFASYDFSIHSVPVNIPTPAPFASIKEFELIYLKNTTQKKSPCLLFLHGGPHVSVGTDYAFSLTFLAALGYNLIIPNYRGSTSFGKDFVECLPGLIGTLDADDSLQALLYTLSTLDKDGIDVDKVGVIGGSHGGFLSAHMSKYPQFKAAVLRNPVIDIPSMSTLSDIPDWCFYECGLKPSVDRGDDTLYHTLPTLEEIEQMKQCSPSRYIDEIKTPSLLSLGDSDLRVPPSQGLLYYRSLMERNVPTKCVMYPKTGHSLDTVDAKLDQWIHNACWFNKYILENNK